MLYCLDRVEARRSNPWVFAPTKYVIALLLWMVLSLSAALVVSASFDLVFNNFVKTVLMFVVVAGTVRGIRDVERLTLVYLIGATVYAGVVLLRFDLGSGDDWRLGRLYYYDANDFATFIVTAMPFGLYFLHAGRRTSGRVLAGSRSRGADAGLRSYRIPRRLRGARRRGRVHRAALLGDCAALACVGDGADRDWSCWVRRAISTGAR